MIATAHLQILCALAFFWLFFLCLDLIPLIRKICEFHQGSRTLATAPGTFRNVEMLGKRIASHAIGHEITY